MLLTETFSTDFPLHLFPLYTVFVSPGIKLTDAPTGRLSGGVALLVRKQFARFVKQIHVEYDYCVVLQLSKELFGLNKDCILLGIVSPPSNSIYYKNCETDNGMSLVENCIFDVIDQHGELPFLVFGDLNARTGTANANECVLPDSVLDVENDNEDAQNQYCRQSKDLQTNVFGRYLLCIYEQFNLVILNGCLPGDQEGNYTYIAHNGLSVIDSFLLSRCLVHLGTSPAMIPNTESKHMPVELELELVGNNDVIIERQRKVKIQKKNIWDANKAQDYYDMYFTEEVSALFTQATELINYDVEAAVKVFNSAVKLAGDCMKKIATSSNVSGKPWFDLECTVKCRVVRKALRKFNAVKSDSNSNELRINYIEERREYKQRLKQNKKGCP